MQTKELKFTSDWFSKNIPFWEKHLARFKGIENINALEIGSWEGRSACWLLENILTHETSRLVCVDNFKGNDAEKDGLQDGVDLTEIERTLHENLKAINCQSKTKVIKIDSEDFLKSIDNDFLFDIIYIDGSHEPKKVLADIVLAWQHLKTDGVMIMDDYMYSNKNDKPCRAIDAFFYVYESEIDRLHKQWQMIWRKK